MVAARDMRRCPAMFYLLPYGGARFVHRAHLRQRVHILCCRHIAAQRGDILLPRKCLRYCQIAADARRAIISTRMFYNDDGYAASLLLAALRHNILSSTLTRTAICYDEHERRLRRYAVVVG